MTIDQFLTVLTQCNLLSEERLGDAREQILHNSRMEPQELAKSLVADGQITQWQARQLLLGQNAFFLGKYELLDCIGRGGMGVVFKARHAVMDRIVALKIMSPALLRHGNAVARFNREVKTVAALHHPNIIGAYDADCVGNTHFLVMEYANGRDLNYWLRTLGRMPISLACECILQAAEGLAHAFRLGMVHRDIKPVNMLVTWQAEIDRPVIKILDLGLARFASETQEEGGLTRVGQTIGTPDYIAPEAAQNFRNADIRADLFSLGCAMFKLLTARLPFDGDNTMAKLMARTSRDAPRASSLRKDVPPEVDAIVAKMLARDPKDRFQTPAEVIAAIAPFAASTRNDQAALQIFKSAPPVGDSTPLDAPDGDPEGDLIEFFRDIGFAPAEHSDRSSAGDHDDDELQLVPLEDEPTRDDTTFQPKPAKPAPPLAREPAKPPRSTPAAPAETRRGKESQAGRETRRAPEPAGKSSKSPRSKPAVDEVLSMEDVIVDEVPVLGAEDLVSEPVGAPYPPPPAPRTRRRVARLDKKHKSVWDSPLLLIGGGALLLLLIVGGGLTWSITRQTGDELLRLAEDDFRSGAFTSAVNRYNQYLQDFPTHPQASLAKVHRGLAQLRQQVDAGGNPSAALAEAQRVIDEIKTEPEFGEARGELAALLPKIAKALADRALQQQDLKGVEQAEVALDLIDKYVLKNQRPEPAIKDVQAILEQTRRQVARSGRLKQAIAAMQADVAKGAVSAAYDTRRLLLKDYPDLEVHPELKAILLAVSAAERQAVKQVNEPRPAETAEAPSPVLGSLTLAIRGTGAAPGVDGRVVYALAEGAAYGLDAAGGRVLWRRFVGYDTQVVPIPLQPAAAGDCLLVDSVRHELLRADSRTGQIRWRHPLDLPFDSEPLVLRTRVVLATESGRLVSIDLETGNSSGYTQIPQPLRVGPAVDSRQRYLYQLGERASLYVVSAESGECPEVIYLGHESSSIRVPPLAVSRYVIVAENHRSNNSRLRVFVTNEQGLSVTPAQEVELDGHVLESPQIEGSTLVAATDRGAVYVFQIGTPGEGSPLTRTADRPASDDSRLIRRPLLTGGQLWVAGNELSLYDYQAARGRLAPKRVIDNDAGDAFLTPLCAVGRVLYHVRRRSGRPGVAVSAVSMDKGQRIWQTQLAAPLAGHAVANPSAERFAALNAAGALFEITRRQLQTSGVQDQPAAALSPAMTLPPDSSVTVFPDGLAVFAAGKGARSVAVYDPAAASNRLRQLSLPGELACPPAALDSGLLAPLQIGQAFLLDPRSGREIAKPFQPPVTNDGQPYEWRAPASPAQKEVLLSDGRGMLYRVGRVEAPEPHLEALATATNTQPLASPPAALGQFAFGADARGSLYCYTLPDLNPAKKWNLGGEVVWGPQRVGARVVVTTSRDELWAFDEQPAPLWARPVQLPAPLAGAPLEVDGGLVVATVNGVVGRIDLASGELQGTTDLAQPLSGGPMQLGDELLLSAHDGTLLRVAVP